MAAEPLLKGRTALITGASGIAAATAKLFHSHGAHVGVADRSSERLAELQFELHDSAAFEGDLTSPDTCARIVGEAVKALGHLDILINVVGLSGRSYGDGPVHEVSETGWDVVMNNNAKTTFFMCREVLAHMLERRSGAIVNTSSVLAYAPSADHFATHAYAASKGAINSLTKAMAAYYAAHGIRVNAIAPGLITTPMSRRAQANEAIARYIQTKQPLTGSFGSSNDVAQAALYLASDMSRFVTGEIIEVAGGWSVAG